MHVVCQVSFCLEIMASSCEETTVLEVNVFLFGYSAAAAAVETFISDSLGSISDIFKTYRVTLCHHHSSVLMAIWWVSIRRKKCPKTLSN